MCKIRRCLLSQASVTAPSGRRYGGCIQPFIPQRIPTTFTRIVQIGLNCGNFINCFPQKKQFCRPWTTYRSYYSLCVRRIPSSLHKHKLLVSVDLWESLNLALRHWNLVSKHTFCLKHSVLSHDNTFQLVCSSLYQGKKRTLTKCLFFSQMWVFSVNLFYSHFRCVSRPFINNHVLVCRSKSFSQITVNGINPNNSKWSPGPPRQLHFSLSSLLSLHFSLPSAQRDRSVVRLSKDSFLWVNVLSQVRSV